MAEPVKAPQFETPMDFEPAPLVNQAPVRERHAILEPQLLALNAHAPSYPGSIMSEDHLQTMSTTHTPAQSTYKEAEYYQPTPMVQAPRYQMVQYVHPGALTALQEKNAQLTAQVTQLTAQVNAHRAAQDKIHREYQTELGKVQQETAHFARLHQTSLKRFEEEKSQLRHHYELHVAALCQQLEEARAENAFRFMENQRWKAQSAQVQALAQVPDEEIVQPLEENTYQAAPRDSVVPVTAVAVEEPRALLPVDEPKVVEEPVEQPTVVAEPPKVVVPNAVEQLAGEPAVVNEPAEQPTVVDEPAVEPAVAEEPVEKPKVEEPVRQRRKRRVGRAKPPSSEPQDEVDRTP